MIEAVASLNALIDRPGPVPGRTGKPTLVPRVVAPTRPSKPAQAAEAAFLRPHPRTTSNATPPRALPPRHQVIGDARPDDPAADDDDAGLFRKGRAHDLQGVTRTAQNLNSGILPSGSSSSRVSRLAAASRKWKGTKTEPRFSRVVSYTAKWITPRRLATVTRTPSLTPIPSASSG